MENWDELDKEEKYDRDEEEANLSLMASTSSNIESDIGSGTNSKEVKDVFSNLSCSKLTSFIQEITSFCQDKVRQLTYLKRDNDLLKVDI